MSLFKACTQANIKTSFPTLCAAISNIKMRELLRVLRYMINCAHTHFKEYDPLDMFYVAVPLRVYRFIAPPCRIHPNIPQNPDRRPNYTGKNNATV